ncbi:DNA helicase [Tanacetum coccineum]
MAGSIILSPSTFTRGPRYVYSHYLDALAICRSLGNPQFFITFTCNVKWPKIKRYASRYPRLTLADRADIVCRVFQQKVKDFVKFLKEVKTFGRVVGVLYTIEFQKRGLSHCHTLLWVDSKNKTTNASQIDEYISAELPDPVKDHRGPDRILANISRSIGEPSTSASANNKQIDEIQNYVDGRFICTYEACWRIFDFPIHSWEPAVQILNVHLEDKQRVTFHERERLDIISLCGMQTPNNGSKDRLQQSSRWEGCKSPTEVKTVNDEIFTTYRAACEALVKLWNKHWKSMQDDIPMKISESTGIPNYHCVRDFGLQPPPEHLLKDLENKRLMEEKNYNRELLMQDAIRSVPKLNYEQKKIYDLIMNALTINEQELLFVYGHGGTGKTFLWKTIISSLRSQGKIFLAVASSGIASLLLPAGRTAHSRFKLPLELTYESLCHVKKNTQLGKLLVKTDLIIWDEAPMNDKRCFKTLDRTLRDLMSSPDLIFGGKTVVLGGEPDNEDDQDSCWIRIPPEYCVSSDDAGMSELIDFIYDQTTLKTPTTEALQEKAIACPKNKTVDVVNAKILSLIEGQGKTYLSKDEAIPMGKKQVKQNFFTRWSTSTLSAS